jgi:hypothetical protein
MRAIRNADGIDRRISQTSALSRTFVAAGECGLTDGSVKVSVFSQFTRCLLQLVANPQ